MSESEVRPWHGKPDPFESLYQHIEARFRELRDMMSQPAPAVVEEPAAPEPPVSEPAPPVEEPAVPEPLAPEPEPPVEVQPETLPSEPSAEQT